MRIHAWKGERYYPKGPASDYLGCFENEDAAKAAVGNINGDYWATLMQETEGGKLVPLRAWNSARMFDFAPGWRDFDPEADF